MKTLLAILVLLQAATAGAATFFQSRSDANRCEALQQWIRTYPLARMTPQEEDIVTALLVADDAFVPAIGKRYGALSQKESKRIAETLVKCFPGDDWIHYRLVRAFGANAPNYAAMRGPIEIPLLGIQVEQGFIHGGRYYAFGARVVKVREGSTAFLAGMHPGHVITKVGRFETKDPKTLASVIEKNYRAKRSAEIQTEVFPGGRELSSYKLFPVLLEESDGRWLDIADAVDHEAAREDVHEQFETALAESLAEARSKGCALTKERLAEMVDRVDRLARKAGENAGFFDDQFAYAKKIACENSTHGLLPDFETWVLLVTQNKVDPCADDAVSAENAEWAHGFRSRPEYDGSAIVFEMNGYLRQHPDKEECVFDRIEKRLLGK